MNTVKINKNIVIIVVLSVLIVLCLLIIASILTAKPPVSITNSTSNNSSATPAIITSSGPASKLPSGICPDSVKSIDGQYTAVYDSKLWTLPQDGYDWVQTNCFNKPTPTLPPGKKDIPPVIKNLGINIQDYNQGYKNAGDFVIDDNAKNAELTKNKPFYEFGAQVKENNNTTTIKEIRYIALNPNANIQSTSDGVVTDITFDNDIRAYTVTVRPDIDSIWKVVYRNITDVRLKKGDMIHSNDSIGKPTTSGNGLGTASIQVVKNETTAVCPYKVMDNYYVNEIGGKFTKLMKDWESYIGSVIIYNESVMTYPGCNIDSINL